MCWALFCFVFFCSNNMYCSNGVVLFLLLPYIWIWSWGQVIYPKTLYTVYKVFDIPVDAWLKLPAFLGVPVSGVVHHVHFFPIGAGRKSSLVNRLLPFHIHLNEQERGKKLFVFCKRLCCFLTKSLNFSHLCMSYGMWIVILERICQRSKFERCICNFNTCLDVN